MVRLKGRQISKLTKNNYNQGVKSLWKEHVNINRKWLKIIELIGEIETFSTQAASLSEVIQTHMDVKISSNIHFYKINKVKNDFKWV